MNLTHYRATPLLKLESVHPSIDPKDRPFGYGLGFKPVGLWVSIDGKDDWKAWCEEEEFGIERLACVHTVILKPNANILILDTVAALDAFTEKYRVDPQYPPESSRHPDLIMYIDWERLRTCYQGLIIAPYQYERRLSLRSQWYYSWDCASGCIWDMDAIESITCTRP